MKCDEIKNPYPYVIFSIGCYIKSFEPAGFSVSDIYRRKIAAFNPVFNNQLCEFLHFTEAAAVMKVLRSMEEYWSIVVV